MSELCTPVFRDEYLCMLRNSKTVSPHMALEMNKNDRYNVLLKTRVCRSLKSFELLIGIKKVVGIDVIGQFVSLKRSKLFHQYKS